ncbi:MAG: ATP-binding protein [Opitutales bacterium]
MIDLGNNEQVRQMTLRTLADGRHLSEKVDDWMRVLGYAGKDLFAVQLALGEAVINAFRHGNQGDPGKVVRVRYLVTRAEAVIEVEDEGAGFDPNQVPDPRGAEQIDRIRGRGLFLMRVYMSGVNYNQQGNRVTLCRLRSQP